MAPRQDFTIHQMRLFAAVAANEAERAAPETTIVDIQMMGASGRVFMSGETADLERARDSIEKTLKQIKGRRR